MTKENEVSGVFNANIHKVEKLSGLNVSDFVKRDPNDTPGNVAVCLSGGGSRAMSAGMGQLRGLKKLTLNGKSLLEQTKAVSTVSGGSWLGVTFEYLNDKNVSDDDYLGTYEDPGSLTTENIKELSEKAIGYRCTKDFSVLDLLFEAVWIGIFDKVPTHMLWQTLMGIHILEYYGLFTSESSHEPDSFFTFDKTTLDEITGANESLAGETAHLIASREGRVPRPFQVCNMGMFVKLPDTGFEYLVPFQATPFFSGVVSTPPEAKDFNGQPVGGGGVTSFGFNSDLESVDGDKVKVKQSRQWALVDIVGTSSAAFAADLQKMAAEYENNPLGLFDKAKSESLHYMDSLAKVKPFIKHKKTGVLEKIFGKIDNLGVVKDLDEGLDKLKDFFEEEGLKLEGEVGNVLKNIIKSINPLYKYWGVVDISPDSDVTPTNFADGGNVENTGINAMLTYKDIDRLISFVNCETPMTAGEFGVYDVDGNPVEKTNIVVDSQIPPLFGYQPYNDDNSKNTGGYRTYKDKEGNFREDVKDSQFRNSQVFSTDDFPAFLKGIWKASGSGSNAHGANLTQTLTTLPNKWFGVEGGREIAVLWVYNNYIGDWVAKLDPGVQNLVNDTKHFPNYKTFHTNLSCTEVNLLSGMTSWNVVEGSKEEFQAMYEVVTE